MRPEPNAPWWLAATVTALPVALAVVLVAVFPPGYRGPAKADATPAMAVLAR